MTQVYRGFVNNKWKKLNIKWIMTQTELGNDITIVIEINTFFESFRTCQTAMT